MILAVHWTATLPDGRKVVGTAPNDEAYEKEKAEVLAEHPEAEFQEWR